MVLARVAEYLFPSDTISHYDPTAAATQQRNQQAERLLQQSVMDEEDLDAVRPPYIHVSRIETRPRRRGLTEFRQCWQEVSVV